MTGRIIQVCAVACDGAFKEVGRCEYTLDPEGVHIADHSSRIHGFTDMNILEAHPVPQAEGARRT